MEEAGFVQSFVVIYNVCCAFRSHPSLQVGRYATIRNGSNAEDSFRKGPIGALNRFLMVKLPAIICAADDRLTGGRTFASAGVALHYLMNENHPLVLVRRPSPRKGALGLSDARQGFFLILLSVSQLLFLPAAFPHLNVSQRQVALFLSVMPYSLIYACVRSTSSFITIENHPQRMRQYPYDHVLFEPGQACRTCSFYKPARSKHCSICKACISKHDHHCIWVMNCLGKGNYVRVLFNRLRWIG